MNRFMRILAMAVGSVALFALFAVAGWAITDQFMSEDVDAVASEAVVLTEYPLVPANEDAATQFVALGEEQEMTARSLEGEFSAESVPDGEGGSAGTLGAAHAGGQVSRAIDRSATEIAEVASDGTGEGSPSSPSDPPPPSNEAEAADAIPTEVEGEPPLGDSEEGGELPAGIFDDMPFLFDHLNLDDVRIADPVGPIRFDVCAGAEYLLDPPEGCASGIGGTIVTLDLDVDPNLWGNVNTPIFSPGVSGPFCGVSDDETWRLPVQVSHPGTVHLTMWGGTDESIPPADAFSQSFDVPDDIAATLPAPAGATFEERVKTFCIQVPAVAGRVTAESYLVSSHSPDAGAQSVPYRWSMVSRSGRPPTGLTAFGVDTLYVRTIRSEHEQVWVKALEMTADQRSSEICSTGGAELSARGPIPQGHFEAEVIGQVSQTIPITIDDTWPYETKYNTLEVRRLQLLAGTDYALCTYVVGGNRARPSIVYSEASYVGTAGARPMQVKVDAVVGSDRAPEVALSLLRVTPRVDGCRTEQVAYPGRNVYVQRGTVLCGSDEIGGAISNVLTNGGFVVSTYAVAADGRDRETFIRTDSWVPVDRSDVLCADDACWGEIEKVVRIPIKGYGWTATRRVHATIANVDLAVTFTRGRASYRSRWTLHEPLEYDATNPELTETMIGYVGHETTLMVFDSGSSSATAELGVGFDRPASFRAWIDPRSPTCAPEGSPAVLEKAVTEFAEDSMVTFSGLCIGHWYTVGVEAVDASGGRLLMSERFRTNVDKTVTLHATIETGFPTVGSDFDAFLDMAWQEYSPLEVSFSGASERPELVTERTEGISGWLIGEGVYAERAYQCFPPRDPSAETYAPTDIPLAGTWTYTGIPIHSLGWNLSTVVKRGDYWTPVTEPACALVNDDPRPIASGSAYVFDLRETLHVGAAGLTLDELLDGVEISVPRSDGRDGATLTVRAELVNLEAAP